jgi:group I intron endonuclease
MYSVYKIQNKINQKIYIGFTGNVPARKRFHRGAYYVSGHLHRAIRKYGWENFTFDVIFESNDKDIALEKEIYFIEQYDSYNSGYNNSIGGCCGGSGRVVSDEVKSHMSQLHSGKNNPFYGQKHSDESRKLMSEKSSLTRGNQMKQPNICPVMIDGVEYPSLRDAAKALNITRYMVKKLNEYKNK